MGYIYRLNLDGGKYYIGYTERVDEDIGLHYMGMYEWTKGKIYSYEIVEGNKVDEIYWTLEMMRIYGYNNVRGGYWQRVEMKNPPPVLSKFVKGKSAYNRCTKCRGYGHIDGGCKVKYDEEGDVLMD